MEKMKEQLAELLEVDEVKDSDVLEDFECWDSLTILSIIAWASENKSNGGQKIYKTDFTGFRICKRYCCIF